MKKEQFKRISVIIFAIYFFIAICWNLIASEQLVSSDLISESIVSPERLTVEITSNYILEQPIQIKGDELTGITLYASTLNRKNSGNMFVSLLADGEIVETVTIQVNSLDDNEKFFVPFSSIPIDENLSYLVQITSDGTVGNAISLYYGTNYNLGKGSIAQILDAKNSLRINGEVQNVILYFETSSKINHWFGKYYWECFSAGFLLIVCYLCYTFFCLKNNKKNALLVFAQYIIKYKFLITQLIERDFKNKYKRSILGIFWSLLNPILNMTVQYVVFSLLFKSNIENYALYLIIGIVLFNFFNEATSIASQAIVSNATLITKVYMPKAIYPISAVLSASVNLIISLIPLIVVIIITGTDITSAALLTVFAVLCLLFCSMGVGLLLSALMVFFRDIQFLWGVISMVWMYLTPIFYPINILPNWLISGMEYNPMYHIITFVRTILIDGVSPAPNVYFACVLSAVIPFAIGNFVFKKLEEKFVFYL